MAGRQQPKLLLSTSNPSRRSQSRSRQYPMNSPASGRYSSPKNSLTL